jgi:hypothetical protein
VELAVLTVPRGFPYLTQTVASMLLGIGPGRIWMVCGSRDESHLASLRHHRAIEVVSMSREEAEVIAPWSTQQKIAANFVRALRAPPPDQDIVVAEDDIVVCDDWWGKAQAMCASAKLRYGTFVMRLWSVDPAEDEGAGYGVTVGSVYGGLLICVPAGVRTALAESVWTYSAVGDVEAHDVSFMAFCDKQGIPLLTSNRSLAQHVGIVSTHEGIRRGHAKSHTFGRTASDDADF